MLLSKRSFIKSLFVAPAIVAASNIMPVKAVQLFTTPAPDTGIIIEPYISKSKLITDLQEIQEAASTHLSHEWKLIRMGGEVRWAKEYTIQQLKYDYEVIKTMEVEPTNREIDTTVALMKAHPGSAVIWELPGIMQKRIIVDTRKTL